MKHRNVQVGVAYQWWLTYVDCTRVAPCFLERTVETALAYYIEQIQLGRN